MALNKRKVLDAARKFAQKGAKQKALKEYNKLIQADPRDARLLLEVGEAYRRWGQVDEAIAQYTKVSNQYKQDGFDARAVAVVKQILNLDDKHYSAYVSLAELYQRMGLDSEALSALQTAADGYYRDGHKREALELLRKSAALDPTNTTSRLTVANLLRQEGLDDDAVSEYEAVATELGRQGAKEQVTVVQERILEIQPHRADILTGLAQNLIDLGQAERAEGFAVRALEASPEPAIFELLCSIYKEVGNESRLAAVTRELAGHYRERGDEDLAREVMQRLPADSVMKVTGLGADQSEFDEEGLLNDDELLDDEDFLATEDGDGGAAVDAEADLGDESDVAAEVEQDAAPKLPEGDPEQLLAEASVYLRYGKRDQAVASLNAVLIQQPAHRGALEKLGEAHTEGGQNDEAIDCWRRAAELAHHDGDAAAHEILRDRIAALDAGAAAALEPMTAAGPDAEGDDLVGADESEFEIELGDDVSEDEGSAASESAEASDADELSFELNVELEMPPEAESEADDAASSLDDTFAGDDDIEIEFDSDHGPAPARSSAEDTVDFADSDMGIEISLGDDEEEDAAASASEAVADATDSSDDLGFEIDASELDIDDEDQEAPAAAASRLEASGSAAFGQSTTTSAKIKEELEEAEFYIQQGLVDEAEAIYRRVLSIAPNHPSALLRLGELAAERGDDPAAASSPQLDVDLGELDEGAGRAGEELAADHSGFDVKEGSEVEIGALGQDGTEDVGDASEDLADLMVAAVESVEGGEGEHADEGLLGDTEMDLTAELGLEDDERGEPEIATSDLTAAGLGDSLGDDSTEVETLAADAGTEPELAFGAEPVQAEPDPESPTDDTMPITDLRRDAGEASGSDEETFDLAEALSDVFGEATDEGTSAVIPAPSTLEEGFESLFADFKKGVSATLDEGDFDTRYDLGIAYREMGLYGDAIGEFRICLDSPSRRFEGLYMMGVCALDLGRHSDAISHLEQALATSELPGERQAGIYFDLGRAHQLAGDVDRARSAYDSVRQLDPGFPGVADQLSALAESGAEAAASLELHAGTEEALESFEDLLGDDEPDAEVAPSDVEPEAFESFDDLITDAERIIEEAEPEPAAKPEPKPEPAPKRGGRTGRRKKISFV